MLFVRLFIPLNNEFTTKYYQLDFEDQIDLINEGIKLAKLLEKPGSDILENLRKIKTSKFVDDNLDKDTIINDSTKKLFEFIIKCLVICSPYDTGKTQMLKKILNVYKPKQFYLFHTEKV